MMKRYPLIILSALALGFANVVFAQSAGVERQASQLLDADVKNLQNEEIGEIDDLLVGDKGQITQAVISVGGFLGIGDKQVLVPYGDLQIVAEEPSDPNDGDVDVVYDATKESLEALPAVNYEVED